jgi:AcrR family transcriptional regulator
VRSVESRPGEKVRSNVDSPSRRGPDRRKTTRRRDSSSSLDRLIGAAQVTFAERGYHQANIHEICARANVGIGTFYSHFDHKRDLLQRVFVERVLHAGELTADDLLDHARLVAMLERAADEPVVAGLLRAWYEAVLDEPDLARFQAEWRPSYLIELASAIREARRRAPSDVVLHDPAVIAWTMATLSREMAIHERRGQPDLDTVARLFEELMFGALR